MRSKDYVKEPCLTKVTTGGVGIYLARDKHLQVSAVGVTKWRAWRNFVLSVRWKVQCGELVPDLVRPMAMAAGGR